MPIHDWTRVIPGIFHHFHHEWISTISRALNTGLLPRAYYALAEQITGGLGPDVLALERRDAHERLPDDESGGVALATAPPRVRFTATSETERYASRRSRVVIRHASDDHVVAIIEIVSPGNKSNHHAIHAFVEKALELLDGGIQLLIIDLFPPGPRDPQGIHGAVWSQIEDDSFELPAEQQLTLVSYSSGDVKQAFIEPVATGDPLPEMPLFLTPLRYINVPLDSTYEQAFDAVPARWREELI
jgi:hypothetical protein